MDRFQDLDELREALLVLEPDLQHAGGDSRRHPRQLLGRGASAISEGRIDGDCLAWTPARPSFPGGTLGGPNGEAFLHDPPREAAASIVVGERQHCTSVSLGEIPAREHPQHLLRKLEEPQAVRDRGLGPSDPLGYFAERQFELVYERRVGACFLDGGELLASDVLHQPEQKRVAIAGFADDGGKCRGSGRSCRTPAALSGDELESTLWPPADDDWLKYALQANGARKTGSGLGLEAASWLARIRMDGLDREVEELGLARLA